MTVNLKLFFSVLLISSTLYFGIVYGGPPIKFFLNPHALLLVFLGTSSIFILSNSFDRIISIFKLAKKIIFYSAEDEKLKLIYKLYYVSCYFKHASEAKNIHAIVDHPFISDSLKLLSATYLNEEDFINTLNSRLDQTIENYSEDAECLAALAKYPPAMGLIGATSGMISMMMTIGTDDKSAIGKSMATALIATLWGIALANFVILPMADLTNRMNTENISNRKMISESFKYIKQNKDPKIVLDFLIGHIPFSKREKAEHDCLKWYKKNTQKVAG